MNRNTPPFAPLTPKGDIDFVATCPDPLRCGKVLVVSGMDYAFLIVPLAGERYAVETSIPAVPGHRTAQQFSQEFETLASAHAGFNRVLNKTIRMIPQALASVGVTTGEIEIINVQAMTPQEAV